MDTIATFTHLESPLIVAPLSALVLIGGVIAIGNERERRATFDLRNTVREYALADLAARQAQMARSISYASAPGVLGALNQIGRDAAGEHLDLVDLSELIDSSELAISARNGRGNTVVFTPSATAYLRQRQSGSVGSRPIRGRLVCVGRVRD